MNYIIGIAIGIIVTVAILYLIILSIGYGLGGKSPLLLRPIQILLVGDFIEKVMLLFWISVIVLIIWVFKYHVSIKLI